MFSWLKRAEGSIDTYKGLNTDVVFSPFPVYNKCMKAAQTTMDSQEPEELDAATLAAIDKGIKSLDEGKGVPVQEVRRLIRERHQANKQDRTQ